MFYEEEKIKNILKCPLCEEIFVKPMLLPCGDSICQKCIEKLLENRSEFKCQFCDENHRIPAGGFQVNKRLQRLVTLEPSEIYRGKLVDNLKSIFKEIESAIEDINMCLTNGCAQIDKRCEIIKNDINLTTENSISRIQKLNRSLTEQVDSYRNECVVSYEASKSAFLNHLDQLIKEFRSFKDNFFGYLNQPYLTENDIINTVKVGTCLKLKFKNEKLELNKLLFNGRYIEYKDNLWSKFSNDYSWSPLLGNLQFLKINPKFSELNSIKLREILCHESAMQYSYSNIEYLENLNLVVSLSDSILLRSICIIDLAGNCLKKLDLFSKKCQLFEFLVDKNFIIHSDFDFKSNKYSIVLRDEELRFVAVLENVNNSDLMDIVAADSLLYCLKRDQTLDIYNINENFSYHSSLNLASHIWSDEKSYFKSFGAKNGMLLFNFKHHINIYSQRELKFVSNFELVDGFWIPGADEDNINEDDNIIVKKFPITSKNEIILDLNRKISGNEGPVNSKKCRTLTYFNFDGEVVFERDISDYPSDIHFILDKNDCVLFYDNETIYF